MVKRNKAELRPAHASPGTVHRLTQAEKAGAELATVLSYAAHKKQSLIPYVLQKTWFQNAAMGPASLALKEMQECP